MPHEQKENFLSKNIVPLLVLIFVFALICGGLAITFYNFTFSGNISSEHERWGTLGDFFGGVLNPVFSLFGLLALLLTIILQNKELRLSTKEFSKSAAALYDQSKSIKIQNFENTFFKLISLHNEIISSLVFYNKTKRLCFSSYIRALDLIKTDLPAANQTRQRIPANVNYDLHYPKIAFSVEHYHKNLYQILLFVKNNGIAGKKMQYTNFIRSQLSQNEISLLFFHGLSKYGVKKFKLLIEEYEMLEHLSNDTFLLHENIYLYDPKAFGSNELLLEIHAKSLSALVAK